MTYQRVLGEFGQDPAAARRAYRQFVAEGLDQAPASPLRQAVQGLVLGSATFVQRVQTLLAERAEDPELPTLRRLRKVPPLAWIIEHTAGQFGEDPAGWARGRRTDSIARAVAAWLARGRFGYPAGQTAKALGYGGPSSVAQAVRRVEAQRDTLARCLQQLVRDLAND